MFLKGGKSMQKIDEKKLQNMMFEVIFIERKNLKTGTKNDAVMVEEIAKIIASYQKQRL